MIGDDKGTTHFAPPREAIFAHFLLPLFGTLVRLFPEEVSGITARAFRVLSIVPVYTTRPHPTALTAFEVGLFAWMAVTYFLFVPRPEPTSA